MKTKPKKKIKLIINKKKSADTFQNFTFNLKTKKASVRNETMEGRDYLVVPMVMIVEGVLNGSNGPLYYPAEELAKVPQVWNHKPVVVYHPTMNGQSLSACDKEVINTHKVGLIMNTTFEDGKLKAEAWIEVSRAKEIDERILEAIENNQMMEVSTGLFTENELSEGEFNGKPYTAIARNYRPDHLAILPDLIGACSIEDGAGLLRVNSSGNVDIYPFLNKLGFEGNEKSFDEIRTQLYKLIEPDDSRMDIWIEEIYESYFIYNKDGSLYKQNYRMDKEEAVLDGIPLQVVRQVSYITANNQSKEKEMNIEEFVDALISNEKTNWKESDKEFLMSMNEEQLKNLEPVIIEKTVEKVVEKKPEQPTDNSEKGKPSAPATAEEYVANAPADIRDMLNDGLLTHQAKKAQLIKEITENEKNIFSVEKLNEMSVNELNGIANLARKEAEAPVRSDYSGLLPVGNLNGEKEEALVAPTMNFEN